MLRDFIELHGNTQMGQVTRESVVQAYSTFKKLPPNRNKKPEYRHLTLQQILELAPKETVSGSTARKFASRASQFFNWCVKWDMLAKNPESGLMDKRGDESTERLPFDPDDLDSIFGSTEYQENSFASSYQFWTPLIALYTGARLNEIRQLRSQNIVDIDGIVCFRITPDAGRLKTTASKRLIPVHSRLLKLGVLKLVEQRKLAGTIRLFPKLQPGREGFGQVASKWFGRYRKRCGVTDPKKPFHSFRHTVWTHLSRCGCPEYEIDDLIGHQSQSVGTRRYRSKLLPSHLQETAEKLQYSIQALDRIKPFS